MSHRPRSRRAGAARARALPVAALAASLAVGLAACSGASSHPLAAKPYDASGQLTFNGAGGKGEKADPDRPLVVRARKGGRISDVTATDASGRHLRGKLSADGTSWRSTAALAANTHYTLRVSTERKNGSPGRRTFAFDTAAVAKKRLKVSFGPDAGDYGVGQPLTATLSAPVKGHAARAVVERALKVRSRPAAQGSWYWVDDRHLHYRPRTYWPAHATITARSTLDGVKVHGNLYGGAATSLTLHTGDRVEALANAATHEMTVTRNGHKIRTIPITTGRPGFETRNGTSVILSRESAVRMRGTTVGIPAGSADGYDLMVYWATRLTLSGEYVHAAPWSVGSQGVANVSHGCIGMSTDNAHWFFNTVQLGDPVRVVGSQGDTVTPFDNGYGDWNLSWSKWRQGSALNSGAHGAPALDTSADAARLSPRV